MQVVKTMQVKIVSIGPGKMRPTADAIMAARAATPGVAGQPATPAVPTMPTLKDCIQVAVAAVDDSGRYVNRATLSLCDGKMIVGNTDVGTAPDALNAAVTAVFAELDKAVSALITAGKLGL